MKKESPEANFGIKKFLEGFHRIRGGAFTLIELMVSMTFLVILMLVISQVVSIVQRTWVRANSRVSQFREARIAFDALSRNLSQATLNTYWENEFTSLSPDKAKQAVKKAKNYVRKSELQFVCGPPSFLFSALPTPQNYPGHGVFFQAPLGVTSLVPADTSSGSVDTSNMTGLLCGRGYFVAWGDDTPFRPAFLSSITTVPVRSRFRLLEYSPTAENNSIYRSSLRPITSNSKSWYQQTDDGSGALVSIVQTTETKANRAFTRPIAENILLLIISPQIEVPPGATSTNPYSIAPSYAYDSTLISNPGATVSSTSSQGTQHLLPPLLKVSMVAVDQMAGEELSRNATMRQEILTTSNGLFKSAASFASDLHGTDSQIGTLEQLLISKKLKFRVFTTTLALKQSRWSL